MQENNDSKDDIYTNWYILFTIPILSSAYFFGFIFNILMSFFFSMGEEDRKEKVYVKYRENGITKNGTTASYKTGNLIRLVIIGASIYLSYKGLIACAKVFNASLETDIIFILPFCLAGTASLLFSDSFKNYLNNNDNSAFLLLILSILGFLVSVGITYYLYSIDFLQMGDSKETKDGIFSLLFVPLFIYSGYILPLGFSIISIFLSLKDKNIKILPITVIALSFLIGFVPPTIKNLETKEKLLAEKERVLEEKEKLLAEKRRKKRRDEQSKQYKMASEGFVYYSPEVLSSRYDPAKTKEQDDKELKGTGKGSLLILPSYKYRVKVSVEGFDEYIYGMHVPVGKYEIIVEHEKYSKHKEVYEVKEGGNIFHIKMR